MGLRLRSWWRAREGRKALAGWLACGALAALFLAPAIAQGGLGPGDLLLSMTPWSLYRERFPHVHGVHNPQLDVLQQYFPWRLFAARTLAQGVLPLWNPHEYCGQPFVGNVLSAVFYPFGLLALVMPIGRFFLFSAWCHLTLLGGGMWLLLRAHGLRWPGALTGAVVMMFNPFVVGWLQYAPVSQWTYGWLPLLCWSWRRAWLAQQPDGLVWPALCLGLALLGGHLQMAFYVGLGWLCYAAGSMLAAGRPRRLALWLGAPALFGGLLATPQVLAALELAAWSGRGQASWDTVRAQAFPASALVQLLVPWFFGHNALDLTGQSSGGLYWGTYINGVEASVGTGCAAACLALAALAWRRERTVWVFGALALVAVLLALGSDLYWLLWRCMPGFRELKGLGRALCLWTFAIAALSGFGVEALSAARRPRARWPALVMPLGTAAVVLAALVAEAGRAAPDKLTAFSAPLTGYVLRQAALAVACAATVGHVAWHRQHRRAAWLGALVACELFALGWRINTPVDPRVFFFATPETDFLARQAEPSRLVGVPAPGKPPFLDWLPMNTPLAYGLSSPTGSESLTVQRYRALASAFCEPGWAPKLGSPLLDLVGVRYVVSRADLSGRYTLRRVGGERCGVYENPRALPLAFATTAWRALTPEQQLAALLRPDCDPRVALVDPDVTGFPPPSTAARITMMVVQQPSPQRWTAAGRLDQAAVGVLTTTRVPGWRVWVNGAPSVLHGADAAFMAVALPAGAVTVRWVWSPAALRVGLFLALGALGVLAGWASAWRARV